MRVAGLVIARQRPATAKGITFMLLEDELGHDQPDRLAAGPRPLQAGGARRAARAGRRAGSSAARAPTNVLVDRIERLDRPDLPNAKVKHIEPRRVWSSDAGELSAVVPRAHSFGRRG